MTHSKHVQACVSFVATATRQSGSPGPDAFKLKQNKSQEKDGFPYSALEPKRKREYLGIPVLEGLLSLAGIRKGWESTPCPLLTE